MANIQVKSFITHKRGETDVDIQDSIAYDLESGCFALSDGVTNSFLPKILSDLLTSTYIDGKGKSIFPPPSMPECFMTERNHYMDSLDEDMRLMEEMVEEEFHVGAATFVGLTINGDEFSWQILGDSCLFILPEDGRMRCFCSMTVKVSPQWQRQYIALLPSFFHVKIIQSREYNLSIINWQLSTSPRPSPGRAGLHGAR